MPGTLSNKIRHFFEDPEYKICKILIRIVKPEHIPDRLFLKYQFHYVFGRPLNLKNPKSFNEKLQWLKLYDRNPLYTILVDKYAVKNWVSDKIGEKYIIPTIAEYNNVSQINPSTLPSKFVLKCTHDSGSIAICNDIERFDLEAAKVALAHGLNNSFYKQHREWPYKNVYRRVIAEHYLEECLQPLVIDKSNSVLVLMDYRFYCFNGEPRFIYAYTNYLQEKGTKPIPSNCEYMDLAWNPLPFHQHSLPRGDVPRPKKLDEMILLAKNLSHSIPFARIDFYSNDDSVYFGEITFYPGSGLSPFYPNDYDLKLGQLLKLPLHKR